MRAVRMPVPGGGFDRGSQPHPRWRRAHASTVIPMTIEDAACVSFRALRFAQGKRSEESERVAHDPSHCLG
ncbi:MAG: hypothetical protein KatS3mg058_1999 [Roseiflexus sp.]|nr:MAG: hypothetical protein KatS3mg058_1999 [Roseiflexus sp.]